MTLPSSRKLDIGEHQQRRNAAPMGGSYGDRPRGKFAHLSSPSEIAKMGPQDGPENDDWISSSEERSAQVPLGTYKSF